MATKKTAKRSSSSDCISRTIGGVDVGNDSKRPRTSTATATASVKEEDTNTNNPSQAVSRDNVNSASESNNAVTANNNDNDDDGGQNKKELPTPVELSQELCKIVSDRYSRDESLRTLKNLTNWAFTEDADFLKSFHIYGLSLIHI